MPSAEGHLYLKLWECRCYFRDQFVFLIIMTYFGRTVLISTHKLFLLFETVPITVQILTLARHN